MVVLSFLVGILNPYGIKNMFYSLTSYGFDIINSEVIEMHSFTTMEPLTLANYCFIGTFFILLIGVIYHKNRKVEASQLLLILGTTYMALCNFRNISKVTFVIIGTIIGAGFASRARDLHFF